MWNTRLANNDLGMLIRQIRQIGRLSSGIKELKNANFIKFETFNVIL